ncbi:MAG: hypothetical protein ACYC5Q_13685 [Thermoleophilia bacterium]
MTLGGDRVWIDVVLTGVQVLTLLALIVYVAKTWQMASATRETVAEMRRARESEERPYVVLYPERSMASPLFFDLNLRNFGKTGARNIRMTFSPPLVASVPDAVAGCAFLTSRISYLPPEGAMTTFFDSSRDYFAKGLPDRYSVTISYEAERGDLQYCEQICLDFGQFRGITWLDTKDLGDIHEDLEKVCQRLEGLGRGAGRLHALLAAGLFTHTARELDPAGNRLLGRAIVSVCDSYGLLGDVGNRAEVAQDVQRMIGWLRAQLMLSGGSLRSVGVDGGVLTDLLISLNEACGHRFHMGGKSFDEFGTKLESLKHRASLIVEMTVE